MISFPLSVESNKLNNNKDQKIVENEEYLPLSNSNKTLTGPIFYVEFIRNWIKTMILNNTILLKWILLILIIFGYHIFLGEFFFGL